MDSRYLNRVNAYIQGSIWTWAPDNEIQDDLKEGVQSGNRPVLIISNNSFNQHSPCVNCLTITSQLRNSPVHEPIMIDVESHIQCEQVHTVSKQELTGYRGMANAITLSNVKAKLSIQFDMPTDRSLEILTAIHDSMNNLNEKAADSFGIPAFTDDMLKVLANINNCFMRIRSDIAKLSGTESVDEPEKADSDNATANQEPPAVDETPATNTGKERKHNRYTEADKEFIRDRSNSVKVIMEKYSLARTSVYRLRSIFKEGSNSQEQYIEEKVEPDEAASLKESAGQTNTPGTRRSYTDDEIAFILDESTTVDDIVEMFSLKDKKAGYNLRARYKKPRNKPAKAQ